MRRGNAGGFLLPSLVLLSHVKDALESTRSDAREALFTVTNHGESFA